MNCRWVLSLVVEIATAACASSAFAAGPAGTDAAARERATPGRVAVIEAVDFKADNDWGGLFAAKVKWLGQKGNWATWIMISHPDQCFEGSSIPLSADEVESRVVSRKGPVCTLPPRALDELDILERLAKDCGIDDLKFVARSAHGNFGLREPRLSGNSFVGRSETRRAAFERQRRIESAFPCIRNGAALRNIVVDYPVTAIVN